MKLPPIYILLIDKSVFNLILSLVTKKFSILEFFKTLRLCVVVKLLTIIFLFVLILLIISNSSTLKLLNILILLRIFKSEV